MMVLQDAMMGDTVQLKTQQKTIADRIKLTCS